MATYDSPAQAKAIGQQSLKLKRVQIDCASVTAYTVTGTDYYVGVMSSGTPQNVIMYGILLPH